MFKAVCNRVLTVPAVRIHISSTGEESENQNHSTIVDHIFLFAGFAR